MSKDSYYFPHFYNARSDRKIRRARKEHGLEAYAIFFMILEVLREHAEHKYPLSDVDLLADEFGTKEEIIKDIISNYGLFVVDNEDNFYSPKLIEFLEPFYANRKQRSEAGKASARKRAKKNTTNDERNFNDRSTTVQQVKESKVNKSKEKERKEAIRSPESHADFEEYQTHHEKMSNFAKQYGAMDGLTPREIDHYIVKRGSDDWEKPQGNIIKRITQTNIRADMLYMKRQGWLREPKAEETENTFNGGVMN
jgi:hypothetical protein